MTKNTHSIIFGYALWIFGFTGSHRFYYGKTVSGIIYFFTLGLLGVGWVIDFFLIPGMDKAADLIFADGPIDYNLAWLFLVFLGVFGVHRFYMGKWFTGLLYLASVGLFGLGYLYDLCTLNQQISMINTQSRISI